MDANEFILPEHVVCAFTGLRAKARQLRTLKSEQKNRALMKIADKILNASAEISQANQIDLSALHSDALPSYRDRLTVTVERLGDMAESLRQVAGLPDPVGEVVEEKRLPSGLKTTKLRAPLGVILMIFESRPNVILEAFSLAFKSGNVIALRGGSESRHTAAVFYRLMAEALAETGLEADYFYGITDYDRKIVHALLKRKDWIDVVVPRGGEKLIAFVQETALMPIIKNDRGMCHAYIAQSADLDMAVRIVNNAKTQRPGVCNSLETVLVHREIAKSFLPKLYQETQGCDLRWRVCERSFALLGGRARVTLAEAKDWDTEHLDLILNCLIVNDLDQALAHIQAHSSRHSEVIVTKEEQQARIFQAEVDSAVVYWNASTRFTDGFELGLGGELGISTQTLHVRGPVGLRELTTPRWVIDGDGQTRD